MENLDYSNVRKFWEGRNHMPMKVCEECGELIQAISKCELYRGVPRKYDTVMSNLKEEIRDVYIMLGALCEHYNIDLKVIKWDVKTRMKEERDPHEFE